MKFKTLYLAAAILFSVLQGVMADEAFRNHRYDSWKVMKLPENAIVFVGNSITDMHVWTEAFGNDPRVVNRGNSGGYSFEVLDNVESWVRFKPAKVFIKIGTNDLGTDYREQSIADNISKTVKIIRRESPKTEIYLQSILPAYDQKYKTLKTIQATNKLIQAIAEGNEKITYVDLYSKMSGILNGSPYSLDRLHLEAYGYKVWVDAIKDYVGIEPSYPANTETIQSTAGLSGPNAMRATYFSVLPIKSTDVLFFGDEMVKNGEWNELLNNKNVKNRGSWWGYGGNIDAVSRLVDAALANGDNGVVRQPPAKIILYTGTEDINGTTDLDAVKTKYTALVEKLKENAPSTPIALVSLMPTSSANDRITEFNSWLQGKANEDERLTYIDIYTDLATSDGVTDKKYFTGNYLYGMGYIVVARKLATFVDGCTVISDNEAQNLKDEFTARTALNKALIAADAVKVGDEIGQYSQSAVAGLLAKVSETEALLSGDNVALSDIQAKAKELNSLMTQLKKDINTPTAANVANRQFTLNTPFRSGLFAYANGGSVSSAVNNSGYASFRWTFESRSDGTFNIKNVGTEAYMDPSAQYNKQIMLTETVPNAGWTVEYADNLGLYIIHSANTCQLNATTLSSYPVYNWFASGTNAQDRTDTGCQWLLTDVTDVAVKEEPTPIQIVRGKAQAGASVIEDGRIYTITNRQKSGVCYPLYADNATLMIGASNALASKSYGSRAKFVAIKKGDNIFAFKNVATGSYLVWKGSDSGTNNNSGLIEDFDSIYCCFKITAVSVLTNGKMLTSKRADGTSAGTFVQNADGSWNKWGAGTLGYNDKYSNVYTFGDVTDGNDGEVIDESLNTDWEPGIDWYTMQIGSSGIYISNNGKESYISLKSSRTEFADADLWYRTGNDTDGYTIYNKEAGPNMVLAAPTTMTGTNGGDSYPKMVSKSNIPSGYTDKWMFAKSTNLGNDVEAYYMYEKGYESNKVNNRNGKFAFWTTGADAGSTIQLKWAQRTMAVNMSTGTFTSSSGTWAKTWTSTATTPQLVVDAGYNNISMANSNTTRIQAFRGIYEPQAYTLSVGADYVVAAYSFDFKMSATTAVTLTDAAGNKFTSSATVQSVDCKDLTEPSTSFQLSGANAGIDITNFLVTIRKATIPAEPQFEVFPTPTTAAIPYRIPAIATAYDGTIVAVADYRYSRVDIGSGRIDLHIRRSHDNGQTWDEIMKPEVMAGDGNTAVGHQKAGFGDPCIVGDVDSPRMLITSCSGTPGFFGGTRTHHQGWARWYSEDNGATWSEPEYMDEEFIYSKFDKSQYGPIRGWFVGSGKICQSRTIKKDKYYRLYCVGSSCRQGSNETANWALYSDDFGKTWNFLGGCDVSPVPGGDEPKAEELPDGSVLLSSRCTGGRYYNIYSFTDSKTGEGHWGQVAFSGSSNNGVTALSNACNGEVMIVPVTRKSDNKKMFLLLQSVPFGSGRTNVGIYYKELSSLSNYRTPEAIAKDWTGRHQSSYISSAYSTMTWQKNNTIGFVYEEDTYGTSGGGYTIVYKNYSIEQLTDSAYTYCPGVNGDSLTALGVKKMVDDMTSGGNVGTFVGQYTAEAASLVNDAYQDYSNQPSRQKYEALNRAISMAPRVEVDEGRYYLIRNFGRGSGNYLLNANTAAELGTSTNSNTDKALWRFEQAADGTKTFFLINKAFEQSMVGPTLDVEKRSVLTTTKDGAGVFRVSSNTQGLSNIQCTNPTNNTYSYLHLSNDNVRIVPWLAASPSGNAASFWYIEPTDFLTDVKSVTDNLDSLLSPSSDVCYDLNGRIIDMPQKGQVYIRRGKKFKK